MLVTNKKKRGIIQSIMNDDDILSIFFKKFLHYKFRLQRVWYDCILIVENSKEYHVLTVTPRFPDRTIYRQPNAGRLIT
jgi:hypothetical protein